MRRVGALPELLAPAGDMECLFAAVAAGADAIMIHSRKKNPDEIFALAELCAAIDIKKLNVFNELSARTRNEC